MYLEFTSILHMIFLIHVGEGNEGSPGQTYWPVRCNKESICALKSSEVIIGCSYSLTNIQTVIWFSHKQRTKWRNEEHPEDLALDSDYAGRVDYIAKTNSTCRLRIRDLRDNDSGEYRLMLFTTSGQEYVGSTVVNLTVTDIQVRTHAGSVEQREQSINLTCITSCKLDIFWYTWYKNGQRLQATSYKNAEPLVLSSADGGSYSCSINDQGKIIHSPVVCVWGTDCFSVTYADRGICALEGSFLKIPCTYVYPKNQTVNETYWSYNNSDIRQLKQLIGRVAYTGDKNKKCTLGMTGLRQNDSGMYHFSFMTSSAVKIFSGLKVQLTVAGVEVEVGAATVSRQTIILSCKTTCTLIEDTTYIWYKNGQPISNKNTKYNKLYLDLPSYKTTDSYTCAVRVSVKGHPAVWGTVGVIAMLLLLLVLLSAVLYFRRKREAERDTGIQSHAHPEDDTYTTLSTVNASSEYYTLRGVYTALQKRAPEAEYETLQRIHPAKNLD